QREQAMHVQRQQLAQPGPAASTAGGIPPTPASYQPQSQLQQKMVAAGANLSPGVVAPSPPDDGSRFQAPSMQRSQMPLAGVGAMPNLAQHLPAAIGGVNPTAQPPQINPYPGGNPFPIARPPVPPRSWETTGSFGANAPPTPQSGPQAPVPPRPIDARYQQLMAAGQLGQQGQAAYGDLAGLRQGVANAWQIALNGAPATQQVPSSQNPQVTQLQQQAQRPRTWQESSANFLNNQDPADRAALEQGKMVQYGGSYLIPREDGGFALRGRNPKTPEQLQAQRDAVRAMRERRLGVAAERQEGIYQRKRKPTVQERMEAAQPELAVARRRQELGNAEIAARKEMADADIKSREKMQGKQLNAAGTAQKTELKFREKLANQSDKLQRFVTESNLKAGKEALRTEYGFKGKQLRLAEQEMRQTQNLRRDMMKFERDKTKFEQRMAERGMSAAEARSKWQQKFEEKKLAYDEKRTSLAEKMATAADKRAAEKHDLEMKTGNQALQEAGDKDWQREKMRYGAIVGAPDPQTGQWQLSQLQQGQQGQNGSSPPSSKESPVLLPEETWALEGMRGNSDAIIKWALNQVWPDWKIDRYLQEYGGSSGSNWFTRTATGAGSWMSGWLPTGDNPRRYGPYSNR
ncbi:MAG: hypothetical protein KDD44_02100, partial [Bdellovibrionales bacterium]|nr:hypothetical protein [Bdellovibrionales bacterium]